MSSLFSSVVKATGYSLLQSHAVNGLFKPAASNTKNIVKESTRDKANKELIDMTFMKYWSKKKIKDNNIDCLILGS
ncbi:hypothetical protein WA026_003971 [Henosepilachna vigintioctopunctata]|uniref:Uncharacterized protein n=1 Tax=Henosepilachna vigintioctopunctata TaxID=420089 RepID=A0AAW1UF75_9CUCU